MAENLSRKLGTGTTTLVIIASMIGTGIFGTSGVIQAQINSPAIVLLLWFLGGCIALAGALSYAHIATLFPETGGEYVYLKNFYNPMIAYLSGWISILVAFPAPVAVSSLLSVDYLYQGFLVWLGEEHIATQFLFHYPQLSAILFIVALTGLHALGVKKGSAIQNILTIAKVILLIGLVFGIFWNHPEKSVALLQENLSEKNVNWSGVGTALLFVMFSYSGWNAACYMGGEVKNPGKTLPFALGVGTAIVTLLYFLLNISFYSAVPYQDIEEVKAIGSLVASQAFGPNLQMVFDFGLTCVLLSSVSACLMIGPRVCFAMAKDGLFFHWATYIHPRFQTPLNAVLSQAFLAVAYIILGSYEQILTYMGFSLAIFPLLTVGKLLFIPQKSGKHIYKIPFGKLLPTYFCMMTIFFMTVSFWNSPFESLAAIALVGVGCLVYKIKSQQLVETKTA